MHSTDTKPTVRQHTLERSVQWRGERRQRQTDVLVVHPAEADTGVRFVCRGAAPSAATIPARWDAVVDTRGGIVLGNPHGVTLRGAIPLLAALRVGGIDNAIVEVHGPRINAEVSDFDFYLDRLADVGVQAQASARRLLSVTESVEVRDRFGFMTLSPDTEFRVYVNMTTIKPDGNSESAYATLVSDFTEPAAGFRVTANGLGAARHGGASDARASRPLREIRNLPRPLRAPLVEMMGHLALAGTPVAGNIRAHGASPKLYQALLHAVMERRAVTLTTVDVHRARQLATAHASADSGIKPRLPH